MKNISLRIVLAASAFALPGFAALGCGGKKPPVDGKRHVIATFADCTVYAGSTSYVFKPLDAKTPEIQFSVPAFYPDDYTGPRVQMPPDLLDPASAEGPPGPNPARLGKSYRISYNAENEVVFVTAETP